LQRNRHVEAYRVAESGKSQSEVFAEINDQVFRAHGPDHRFGAVEGRIVVDPLFQYERLLRGLADVGGLECVPFRELLSESCPKDKIRCGIRHDIDIDIRAALSQAEIEKEYGVRTTYFVLHTAPYYGQFQNGVFYRNGCIAHVCKRIQELGHEIAVHTDALLVYQKYQIDGAEALSKEIEWLRSEGIDIVGTTAHGSAAVYGAENYAIFKGRGRPLPLDAAVNRTGGGVSQAATEVVHNGKWAPLQVLDEAELGLTYEANDVFWQQEVPVEYGALRGVDAWRWNPHLARWRKTKDPAERWFYDQSRMLHEIASLDKGCFLILVVHPVYSGARHAASSAPARRIDRRSVTLNPRLGWETYEPMALQARSGESEGKQEFQAVNMADSWGMLDMPKSESTEDGELRIAIFGGRNLDGSSVSIPGQMQALLSDFLRAALKRPVKIWKFAFPGMGLARHFGWYEAIKGKLKPDIVVLAPGEYLRWTGEGVETVSRSPGAAIRRIVPQTDLLLPSFAQDDSDWPDGSQREAAEKYIRECLKFFVETMRRGGALPLLLVQECGESAGVWSYDADREEKMVRCERVMRLAERLAEAVDVPLTNPYPDFLTLPDDLPSHWRATPQWNYTGHRVAAASITRTLLEVWDVQNPSTDADRHVVLSAQ
jgi:peptidoglycan/xylan/chitin deacetylase (PgdA/CDA1 family)